MKKEKIKGFVQKYINIIIFILTLFIALGLNVSFIQDSNSLKLSSLFYKVTFLIFIVAIFVMLKTAYKVKDKRLWICTSILAIIFAITYLCGDIGNEYSDGTIPNSKKFILFCIMKIATYFILFNSALVVLFNKIPDLVKQLSNNNKEYKFFTNNRKSLLVIALIFFISYIPYFLYYFPGAIQYDAANSLEQICGYVPYSNHHPITYTLFLGGLWNLGKIVFGSGDAGIAIYTLIQMIATSFVFSFILKYMAKRNIPTKWRIITFLVLLLNPLTGMYTVRVEKSLFFTLFMILAIIGIIEMCYEKEKFFKKIWKPILFAVTILMMTLLRNNGIYILILTLPFILLINKKQIGKILITFIVPIIIFFIIQGPILNACNVTKAKTKEALSIPMQQFARLLKYERDNLTSEEKENIHKYLPLSDERIAHDYWSLISDNIKFNFDENYVKQDKATLLKTYFTLALKYPGQTISAFLFNTYGYYAPNSYSIWGSPNFREETDTLMSDTYMTDPEVWVGDEEVMNSTNSERYDIYPRHLLNLSYIDTLNNHIMMKDIPVFSLFITSIGLYFWLLLMCATYMIYTKKYKKLVMLLPVFFLWLTSVAGPVVELRYVYTMILLMPLYIGFTLFDKKEDKEEI